MSTLRNNVKRSNITACRRCKTRKQRCDQEVPACSNCARAGVECLGVGADGSPEPRSYIEALEDHVAQLEKRLASVSKRVVNTAQDDHADVRFSLAGTAVPSTLTKSFALSLPISTQVTIPEDTVLMVLSEKYFEHSDFFSPILVQDDMARLSDAARSDEPESLHHTRSRFMLLMMLSTTMELMQRSQSKLHLPSPEAYRAAAFDILQENTDAVFTGDLDHLECLLLIVQSLEFASDLSNAWHFVGLATRLAVSLHLHSEDSCSSMDDGHCDVKARRLFWTMYNLERNLCVVLGRPFSIPDTAITTIAPSLSSTFGIGDLAARLIAYRRLESEIYQMTQEAPPLNDFAIDHSQWRLTMRTKLQHWRESVPRSVTRSKLAPESFWDGALSNALLRVYCSTKYTPTLSDHDFDELRHTAIDTIRFYRQSFRDGELRFYWRTLHFLYLAGEALLHCAKHLHDRMQLDHDSYSSIKESVDSCTTVLWGMVERCPQGEKYRDRFDGLIFELLEFKPMTSTDIYNFLEPAAFDNI